MISGARVAVGISGGVDSAVAALLLQRQGYELIGVFMKNWEEDDTDGRCSAEEDHRSARAVCAHLGIPLRTVNFAAEYWDRVFSHFLAEHRACRTPNPDILCNREIKFRAFLDYATDLGASHIATGHYAQVSERGDRYRLLKARDSNKDQTYFLYTLTQEQLSRVMFPVGGFTKREVRALARDAGLPNHDRRDSTGICFIGARDHKRFLARYFDPAPGDMRTLRGQYVGRHDGLTYYTIGQRHGLGLGGAGPAWYVVDKDAATNTLYVEQGQNHAALYGTALDAVALHWIAGLPPTAALGAKTRYRQAQQDCAVQLAGSRAHVTFSKPQRAITPGQAVVFYRDDECVGGGTIERAASAIAQPFPNTAACL